MVQMVGVLILAAGVPKIAQGDFATVTIGYAVMRIGLLAMWLRAAREHPEGRRTALRYALGIGGLQILWLARLALPTVWSLLSWCWNWRFRRGLRGRAKFAGMRITWQSAMGYSRSSCWESAYSVPPMP